MFTRAAVTLTPKCGTQSQVREMATLKAISIRLKSVKNIQKITKSMKMVSAAKYAKAERELKPARSYGQGATAFFDKAEVKQDEKAPNHLVIAMTSDRGLCGAVHTGIARAIKTALPDKPAGTNTKIVCVGDKARSILGRLFKDQILMHFSDIGKKPPTFIDAARVANEIINSGYEFDFGEMYYNTFRSVVSYKPTILPIYNLSNVGAAEKINLYDSLDEDVLRSYNEFALTSLIFFAMKGGSLQ
uniref:F-ATPase gamma subunit n=1 Tax=Pectinaria gouldii TaxID=260746 RepID=B6V839_PECGU|nr:hypothetical protein [Pectinaria gouldii]